MAVTIKQVARRARVSVGTVSRVINGRTDVNSALRSRVEKAITHLQYRPNARARNLGRNASPILSFILSNRNFLHPFHSRVLQGVEEFCKEAGYFVLFTQFDYEQSTAPGALQLPAILQSHGIADCLILAGTNYGNFLEVLDSLKINYVALANNLITGKARPRTDTVRFDEMGGAQEAANYLIQLGHRDIWFAGDLTLPWFRARYQGYERAMTEAGLRSRTVPGGLSDNQFSDGLSGVELILNRKLPLTAMLCGSDDVAYGVWEGLRSRNLHVPGDLSLIGFDDQYGPLRLPALTSVRVKTDDIGRELAKMAIEKIKRAGEALPEVIVPTRLERRGTCRPLLEAKKKKVQRMR